jgi:hypothetical protein
MDQPPDLSSTPQLTQGITRKHVRSCHWCFEKHRIFILPATAGYVPSEPTILFFNFVELVASHCSGEGHTVTFMLRKPAVFDKDSKMQKHIKEGRAKIISGDATIRTDVQKALTEARIDGQLDTVLFTVGKHGFKVSLVVRYH